MQGVAAKNGELNSCFLDSGGNPASLGGSAAASKIAEYDSSGVLVESPYTYDACGNCLSIGSSVNRQRFIVRLLSRTDTTSIRKLIRGARHDRFYLLQF